MLDFYLLFPSCTSNVLVRDRVSSLLHGVSCSRFKYNRSPILPTFYRVLGTSPFSSRSLFTNTLSKTRDTLWHLELKVQAVGSHPIWLVSRIRDTRSHKVEMMSGFRHREPNTQFTLLSPFTKSCLVFLDLRLFTVSDEVKYFLYFGKSLRQTLGY